MRTSFCLKSELAKVNHLKELKVKAKSENIDSKKRLMDSKATLKKSEELAKVKAKELKGKLLVEEKAKKQANESIDVFNFLVLVNKIAAQAL